MRAWLIATLTVIGATACSGTAQPHDAAIVDAASVPLPVLQIGRVGGGGDIDPTTAEPADMGCVGIAEVPPATGESTFVLELDDFAAPSTPVAGVHFCVYPEDLIPHVPTCDDAASQATTDAFGRATITTHWPTWYAVEIRPGLDAAGTPRVGTLAWHLIAGAPGQIQRQGISAQENIRDVISLISSAEFAPGTAIVGGIVRDCPGNNVFGASLRIARPDGTYIEPDTETAGVRITYGNGRNVPVAGRSFTHVDGFFAFANLPVDDGVAGEYLVEVWGRPDANGDPRVVSCEHVLGRPGAISTLQAWPLRAGETACPGLTH